MKYIVDFSRFNEHLVDIHIHFKAQTDAPILWLPTWIAGSYLIREFSKNITLVQYGHKNTPFDALKRSKNTYELTRIKTDDEVYVHYEVYCHDLSVRTAFIDDSRLFGNFSSLLLMVDGQENTPVNIHLSVPNTFYEKNPNAVLACGLNNTQHEQAQHTIYQLQSVTAFESYDYPFEIAIQNEFTFNIQDTQGHNLPHRFFIAGKHHANLSRLKNDVQRICQCYLNELGTAPFDDYTFMTMVTGDNYGGLEHINSTALIAPRTQLPSVFEDKIPSKDYQQFLSLCSHEYFHAWWVKTVRPDVMMSANLQTEAPTPLLWVFEGFTSYIDEWMLLKSGIINNNLYLQLLASQINRYYQTDGRNLQSVAESSFDAWIKLYRADENYTNQGVSYYNKGALVALLLDLTLLKYSHGQYRLLDVIKAFYQKALNEPNRRFGMTHDNLGEVISNFIPKNIWQDFFDSYVIGRKSLPIEQMLSEFGIEIDTKDNPKIWGMTLDESNGTLIIKHLVRGSQASVAGLSAGDNIIAINDIKATKAVLERASQDQTHTKQPILVHAFRRDELRCFTIAFGKTAHRHITLKESRDSDNLWLP